MRLRCDREIIAPMDYGTLDYYAARFVHTWTVEI